MREDLINFYISYRYTSCLSRLCNTIEMPLRLWISDLVMRTKYHAIRSYHAAIGENGYLQSPTRSGGYN
jgi:hypothetical protein